MFAALALLPPNDVKMIHTKMMANIITFPELREYNDEYFEKTWIKKGTDTNEQNAFYDIKEWNVHER